MARDPDPLIAPLTVTDAAARDAAAVVLKTSAPLSATLPVRMGFADPAFVNCNVTALIVVAPL